MLFGGCALQTIGRKLCDGTGSGDGRGQLIYPSIYGTTPGAVVKLLLSWLRLALCAWLVHPGPGRLVRAASKRRSEMAETARGLMARIPCLYLRRRLLPWNPILPCKPSH